MSTKQFLVILPTGKRHELSAYLFSYYLDVGLLRRDKKPRVARLIKWLRAWPLPSGALKFEVVTPPTADSYALDAVERLWRRILAMAPCSDETLHEQVYDAVVRPRVDSPSSDSRWLE